MQVIGILGGHEVLRLPKIEQAVRERWGEEVFGSDGRLDRSKLARIVFAPPPEGTRERNYLEQLTHPEIGRLVQEEARRLAVAGAPAAVLDAPLLMEAGWDGFCDVLLFVEAPRHVRLARAKSRGWSEEEFAAREGAQESLDFKRQRADVVVDNSGLPEETEAQLERFWRSLIG
jgi:dephospho-CoA kinase